MPKVVPGYKEAAKAKILETAFAIFSQKGFDDSTMDDIADKLGVTKGALYQYFESKDDLLKAIIPMTQQTLREELRRSFEGRDFVDGLRAFLDWMEAHYSKNYGLVFEWFAEAYRDEKVRKLMREDGERDLDMVRDFLEEQKRKGTLKTRMDIRALSELFETLLMGAWVRMASGHDKSGIIRSLKDAVALIEDKR